MEDKLGRLLTREVCLAYSIVWIWIRAATEMKIMNPSEREYMIAVFRFPVEEVST